MAETPKSIKVAVDLDKPVIKRALADAQKMGFEEGLAKGRQEILDWLEAAYIKDEGRPDRGSEKAEAILEMARAASAHFTARTARGGRNSR